MSHASTLPSHGGHMAWTALPGGAPADHGDISEARAPQTYDPPLERGLDSEAAKRQGKTAVVEYSIAASSEKGSKAGNTAFVWLPYALRKPFLGVVAAFALALSITLAVLCWYSSRNSGLGNDDGSTRSRFVWRYLPTIIAVLFTLSMAMIYDDIRRTEPFARLAHPVRVDTKHTLLYKPKAWFKTISEGFSRKHKTGRILLVLSSLATGLTVLSLSTLSSSLLVARSIIVSSPAHLERFVSGKDGKINLVPHRETYFHTTSGYVYNTSTSIWLSDSHVVMPFSIPGLGNLTDALPNGVWEAETKVLQMESTCVPMSLGEFEARNITYQYETDNLTFTYQSTLYTEKYPFVNKTENDTINGFNLQSEDGCKIFVGVPGSTDMADKGGVLWSNLSSSHVSWQKFKDDAGGMPVHSDQRWSPLWEQVMSDFSDECMGRNVLLVTNPWRKISKVGYKYWTDFKMRAELCTPIYYEATLPVNASISTVDRAVTFDEKEFAKRRRPVAKDVFDTEAISTYAFQGNRPDGLAKANIYSRSNGFPGLTEALMSGVKYNYTSLMNEEDLAAQTSRLQSRFFNELMISSVTEQESPVLEGTKGRSIILERRIVVVTEIAIALAVLLFVLACYLLGLLRAVSVRRRPLKLSADPATTIGLATYLNNNADLVTRSSLDVHTSRDQLDATGQSHTDTAYNPTYGAELTPQKSNASSALSSLSNDWRPTSLRTLLLAGLIVAFGLLAAALLVLRNFASQGRLYRSAFVYQVDVEVFKATISPFSLLATFFAVGLALWWDVMEKNMRLLQPYLSMAKRPRVVRQGTGLSYQSSYWVGAAVKAASNRDWLLSLVTVGTTLSQVLVISIAAVFERTPGNHNQSVGVNYMLADRVTPLTYRSSGSSLENPLRDLMKSVTGDWMYSALDEMVLGATPPKWTHDGWTLTPIDLDLLPAVTKRQRENSQSGQNSDASMLLSISNVTLDTTATRARLQCDKVPIEGDSWMADEVSVIVNQYNGRINNMSASNLKLTGGKMLPTRLFENTTYDTTVFASPKRILCCANKTEDSLSAVAYWSFTNDSAWWTGSDSMWSGYVPTGDNWPSKFSIKWIVGPATTSEMTIYTNNQPSVYTPLQFTKTPTIQALDCKPIIEQAQARVTLARSSAQVLEFKLLEDPKPRLDVWQLGFDIDQPAEKKKTGRMVPRQATAKPPKASELLGSDTNFTAKLGFGTYFMTQLLRSASIDYMGEGSYDLLDFEALIDERYNIRDKSLGINLDFPSYSNYFKVKKDPMALTDAETLLNHSQKTFQTFFQHYASNTKWTDNEPIAYTKAESNNGKQADVTMTDKIEILSMVESATWLCLAIIFILMLILIALTVSLRIVYPPSVMKQKVECLADMLALIAGSEELLAHVEGKSGHELSRSGIRTRLGWFKDKVGVVRWGIEVENAVEWIERPGHRVPGK